MKRNWDFIREILLRLEGKGPDKSYLGVTDFDEERRDEAAYHVKILEEAGLIDADIKKAFGLRPDFFAHDLTWAGREFLDAVRSDTVWNRTKQTFGSKGLSMTFDFVKSVAASVTSEFLKSQMHG